MQDADAKSRPGWDFWSVIALSLPVLYGSALGPAAWLSSRFGGEKAVSIAYRPVTWGAEVLDDGKRSWLKDAIKWYSEVGAHGYWGWSFDGDKPGNAAWRDFFDSEVPYANCVLPSFEEPPLTPNVDTGN